MARAAAAMVVSAMAGERVREVRARAVVGGAGMARVGCMEVRQMAATSLTEGSAVARQKRERRRRRAVRSSRR